MVNLLKITLTKICAATAILLLAGCFMRDIRWSRVKPPRGVDAQKFGLITTGYCPCKKCCGWKRNWYFKPVIASGPNKGKKKAVGITASGAPAKDGTIAADAKLFPFGTVMYVPDYGFGVVEDRGGDIKGYHIDLYFSSHQTALEWGRQRKKVKVWFPGKR